MFAKASHPPRPYFAHRRLAFYMHMQSWNGKREFENDSWNKYVEVEVDVKLELELKLMLKHLTKLIVAVSN